MKLSVNEMRERLGYPWRKDCMWKAGSRMASLYRQATRQLPPKRHRSKANPSPSEHGKHMKCVYDDYWWPDIERILHEVYREAYARDAQWEWEELEWGWSW